MRLTFALALLVGGIGLDALAADLPVTSWQGRTMGSDYTVTVVGTNLPGEALASLRAAVEARLREVNRQMSHYEPASELSQFNRAEAGKPFKVSPEFARVMRFSLDLNRRSHGAFDPTLSPVINLWGFGEKTERKAVPSEADLQAARDRTGCQHVRVTERDELIKDLPELSLNLSAVAKGFGVDEMARVLRVRGFLNFHVAIAGEVFAQGHNPRGERWRIGISAPVSHWRENDPFVDVALLSNQAISTSGDYQKFFTDPQGRRQCHILDPRTGWPVQHQVGGVSVVAPDCMTADALATTLFVLGPGQGEPFLAAWTNTAALFVVREADGSFRNVPTAHFRRLASLTP